ncbi:poly-gamma-glutamate biosynthesis protein PgsC/CapC [Pendulispora rubella]|uniref:Poly-gamma-glutamate biosynthesis protein PgsC/CapC n=1 Tax=Pendulispora rubella TaxID=2741070 RepID=A0ABZ2L3E3_9BACT
MHALAIFPSSGFDQSVTTPVLIGVLISWFFTETFGWVFAGLVVPGYLAAVFLVEPASGVVDVVEAVLTFGVARIIGEYLPRSGVMSRVFGRERFLLIVLVSILVRLAVEGWLLPRTLTRATWAYSVGLVLVPLAANACWKTGLVRGIVQNGAPALAVYLLVRYVFLPHTNLSLSGFELATENVAASFLGSPKAYTLLITGALLAAVANLRYGWDFNGILIPALLGLVVTEPVKLVATFAETAILYTVVLGLRRFTRLSRSNIAGPRRVVLFFTVDYALRFVWAAAMGPRLPGGDIVAFMGFGYLLPTLLAVKISERDNPALVLLPTLKVSVVGFVLGSLVGFGAHLTDRATGIALAAPVVRSLPPPPRMAAGAALWAGATAIDGVSEPDEAITGDLSLVRDTLLAACADPQRARDGGMDATRIDDDVCLVRERFERLGTRRGVPTYLLRANLPPDPIVALVPTPLASPAMAAAAGQLLRLGEVDAAVIAGIEEPKTAWIDLETTAHAAARWLASGGVLLTVRDREDPRMSGFRPFPSGMAARLRGAEARFENSGLGAIERDVVLSLDARAIGRALAPPPVSVRLDSATSMAAALETVRPITRPDEVEDLVALRRLVLEPLLSSQATEAARELAPFAASVLGYRLTKKTAWAMGGQGVALLPEEGPRPVAIFVRASGAHERVLEAPLGVDRGVRDLALRLGVALEADAVILGEVFDGAMRGGAVRAAHTAATESRSPTVFLVRQDPSRDDATVAAWMDDGTAIAAARAALEGVGLSAPEVPLDPSLRHLSTRTLLRPTSFVAISAGARALRTASLDDARRSWERMPALTLHDGTLGAMAALVAGDLDAAMEDAVADDRIEETVRRAAADASIASTRRLETDIQRGAVRATIVSAREGTFLIAAARKRGRRLLVAAPISSSVRDWRVERRETFAACTREPVLVGVCEADG